MHEIGKVVTELPKQKQIPKGNKQRRTQRKMNKQAQGKQKRWNNRNKASNVQ